MVDYNAALPQLQQFQAPNMLAMAEMANKMQLHQAQLAEVQRATNEQNQMRALFASGVDRNSPEALRQAYNISLAAGQALEKGQNELKTAGLTQQKLTGDIAAQTPALQKAQTENIAADHKLYSEMLNKVLALDDARAAPAYDMLRAGAASKYKDISTAWPATFDRGVLEKQMLTAEQAAQAQAAKLADERKALQPSVHDFGGTPYSVVGTTAQPITIGGAAPADHPSGPSVAMCTMSGGCAFQSRSKRWVAGSPSLSSGYRGMGMPEVSRSEKRFGSLCGDPSPPPLPPNRGLLVVVGKPSTLG